MLFRSRVRHRRCGLAAAAPPKLTRRFISSPAARLSLRARFFADAAYGSAVDTMASTSRRGETIFKLNR